MCLYFGYIGHSLFIHPLFQYHGDYLFGGYSLFPHYLFDYLFGGYLFIPSSIGYYLDSVDNHLRIYYLPTVAITLTQSLISSHSFTDC